MGIPAFPVGIVTGMPPVILAPVLVAAVVPVVVMIILVPVIIAVAASIVMFPVVVFFVIFLRCFSLRLKLAFSLARL